MYNKPCLMYNPFSLNGKTILITGASSGIGRSTAIECSKLGAKVILTGRNESRLFETLNLLEGSEHLVFQTDLTNPESLNNLVDSIPALDGLVNNAGVNQRTPIKFIKQESLDYIFGINTFSPILLTKTIAKGGKLKNEASIVFTSSMASIESTTGNAIYAASKAAIASFARSCAIEYAPKKIRANAVLPGMIETKLINSGTLDQVDLDADRQRYLLKRYGRPEEVAWGIIYLLSDASSWVTGSSLVINGGGRKINL